MQRDTVHTYHRSLYKSNGTVTVSYFQEPETEKFTTSDYKLDTIYELVPQLYRYCD